MNVKRFVGKTSHEALQRLKAALGPDAVVLSTRPCAEGIELLAMGPEAAARTAPEVRRDVGGDAATMAMSTLNFQDYVRDRMLRRRQEALQQALSSETDSRAPQAARAPAPARAPQPMAAPSAPRGGLQERAEAQLQRGNPAAEPPMHAALHAAAVRNTQNPQGAALGQPPFAPHPLDAGRGGREGSAPITVPGMGSLGATPASLDPAAMMAELRAMKGLIEQRFSALTFLERLQRQPNQARMAQRLMDAGFSPALTRKLTELMPATVPSEETWMTAALERNIRAAEQMPAIEELGGVVALIGSTGVGKTTTTAKIAAAFAARYGAGSLGLITLDAYRIGAQEQLRAYGRILGVPVHSAHDRASLEDLLQLLGDKRLVLIDTAGMAQRDSRTRELLDMLTHPSIQRVLVLNAAAQGETLDDIVLSWRGAQCKGVVLSKVDEAVRLAPVLDTLIRHKLPVMGVGNGQRVPEDWHRLTSQDLVQRALCEPARSHWRMDHDAVSLVFADMGRDAAPEVRA